MMRDAIVAAVVLIASIAMGFMVIWLAHWQWEAGADDRQHQLAEQEHRQRGADERG